MQFTRGFLLSLSLCLDIGIANIAMITLAMQRGYWRGFWLGLGTCFGDLLYALLALAGMTLLLQYAWVRWTLWLGGSVLLVYFALRMLLSACRGGASLPLASEAVAGSGWRDFARGLFLALSSPTAILWFAAVGGVLISRSGAEGPMGASIFLAGFFCAGVLWCAALCLAASQGGKWLGEKLLGYAYLASSAIFCYFAWVDITSGYHEFIVRAPASIAPL
jgi:L-lysine exporter family protein LysE/ArgO